MPKRWIVTYTGEAFDRLNVAKPDEFSTSGERGGPGRVVEADELQINAGALVFKTRGEVHLVFGPTSYWLVELQESSSGRGDLQADESS
ncbi:MAG: hypothetical protein QOK15_832 [Nocardioidaceae bacterium]|jgi:hypothetical protein|nr:hypothetical protein [Nocardioidaceae bacterium]